MAVYIGVKVIAVPERQVDPWRLVIVGKRDGNAAVYRVGAECVTAADAERDGWLVAIRRAGRSRAWRKVQPGTDGRALRWAEPITGRRVTAEPTFCEFELAAADWRQRLSNSQRVELLYLVTPRFPEDGDRALVVLGPFNRDGVGTMRLRQLLSQACVRLVERIIDAPSVSPTAPAGVR